MASRWNIPTRQLANAGIPLEAGAIDELEGVLGSHDTVERLPEAAPAFFGTLTAAGVAQPAAELYPLMTVKG